MSLSFLGFTEFLIIVAQSDPIRYQNLPLLIFEALAPHGPALSTVRAYFNSNGQMPLRYFPDIIRIMQHRGYNLNHLRNYLLQLFEGRPRPQASLARSLTECQIRLGDVLRLGIEDLEAANRAELGITQQLASELIALGEIGKDIQQRIIEATAGHNPEDIPGIELNLPQERS